MSETPITDPKLAAAAPLLGATLHRLETDPSSGKVTFFFQGLPADFLERAFNGSFTVNLLDYMNRLEQVQATIAQFRARRGRS